MLQDPNTMLQDILTTGQLPARYNVTNTVQFVGMNNYMTRVFAGVSVADSRQAVSLAALQLAEQNLARLDAVLLHEQLHQDDRELLTGILGFAARSSHSNRSSHYSTQHRAVLRQLTSHTMAMINQQLCYDLQLWQYSTSLHMRTLSAWAVVRGQVQNGTAPGPVAQHA